MALMPESLRLLEQVELLLCVRQWHC